MSKHTPGPWNRLGTVVWDEKMGRVVAQCATTLNQMQADDANARLIAAAPDLLEALKEILTLPQLIGGGTVSIPIQNARAAIAKATT